MSRGRTPKWRSPGLLVALSERYDRSSEAIDLIVSEFQVPRSAVHYYARKLGVARTKEPIWSDKDTQFLIANWSRGKSYCARKLKRTEDAVWVKAQRTGLGGVAKGSHNLSGKNIADILGINLHTVLLWIKRGRLVCKRAPFKNRIINLISPDDLEAFLENNLELWDSRKMKVSLWLQDPEWLIAKKAIDRHKPKNAQRMWTSDDDKRLIGLYKSGTVTHKQIGAALGRSTGSVGSRLSKLDVWGDGSYVGSKSEKKPIEREQL